MELVTYYRRKKSSRKTLLFFLFGIVKEKFARLVDKLLPLSFFVTFDRIRIIFDTLVLHFFDLLFKTIIIIIIVIVIRLYENFNR